MSDPVPFKTVVPFLARFTLSNVPVPDAIGVIYIYRLSDFKYWNDVSGLWEVARVSNAMTEISETNQLGDWIYNFDTALGDQTDEYIIEMEDSAVGKSDNLVQRLSQCVGGWLDRLFGLMNNNIVVQATAVSINGKMTEGDRYHYDTPANATADGRTPATGLIAKYHIVSPLTVEGEFDTYTQTEVVI